MPRGDLAADPFQPGVMSPHRALKLGKLAHHPGGEVGLAEASGLENVGDQLLPAERAGQPTRHRADAVDSIELAAQPGLVGPATQFLDARPERALAVLLEEEPGVGEPRSQDPLVAVPGHGAVFHRRARDRDEPVGEPAVRVEHREVALVVAHLRDDHLGREFQVGLLEGAGDAGGVLDQPGDLIDERLVLPEAAPHLARRLGQLLLDGGATLGRIDDHPGLAQLRDVVLRRPGERDGAGGEEAVTGAGSAAANFPVFHLE
jgi:hypothetical protein